MVFRIIILFQWTNGCCFFLRCVYSTTNHTMCYPFVPIIIVSYKKLVEIFYHYDTVDSGSLTLVVVDNMGNRVVYNFSDHDMVFFTDFFIFVIYIFWPMGGTCQLIGGLVPIILTESSSNDNFFHVHQYFWKGLMNCTICLMNCSNHLHQYFCKFLMNFSMGLMNCPMHFYCCF